MTWDESFRLLRPWPCGFSPYFMIWTSMENMISNVQRSFELSIHIHEFLLTIPQFHRYSENGGVYFSLQNYDSNWCTVKNKTSFVFEHGKLLPMFVHAPWSLHMSQQTVFASYIIGWKVTKLLLLGQLQEARLLMSVNVGFINKG